MTVGLLEDIRASKTRAKNRRDDGRFDRALRFLADAADLATRGLDEASSPAHRSTFAGELADIYGMMGGIERRKALHASDEEGRAEHLAASVRWYDEGYTYESEEYGVVSSYNLVNRLVSRILADPELLADNHLRVENGVHDAFKGQISDARRTVARQLEESRSGDPWALADLALLDLLGNTANATSAYSALYGVSPPEYVYRSALDTLQPLAALESTLQEELSIAVSDVTAHLNTA